MQVSSNDGEDKEALHTFSFSHTFHGLTAKPKGKGTNSALSKKLHHKASFLYFPARTFLLFCAAFDTTSVSVSEEVHSLNFGNYLFFNASVRTRCHRQTYRRDRTISCYELLSSHTSGGANAK